MILVSAIMNKIMSKIIIINVNYVHKILSQVKQLTYVNVNNQNINMMKAKIVAFIFKVKK